MFWTTTKQASKKKPSRPKRPRKTTTEAARIKDAERKRRESLKRRDVPVPACEDPERRKRLEADDAAWLRWYFGGDCPNPFTRDFTPDQLEMIAAIRHAADAGGDQAIAASRGEGKTSVCERLCLKFAAEGRIDFVVLFAATGTAAEQSLDSIKEDIATNDRLAADYPDLCVPVRALENTPNRAHYQTVSGTRHDNSQAYVRASSRFKWCGSEIVFPDVPGASGRRAVIATRGLDAAVRGLKRKGKRPSLAIIDDPDTEQSAASEGQAGKIEKRIDKGIGGLGTQTKPIARVMLTTLQSRISISYRYTDPKQKSSWNGKRFRFLKRRPDREDLWSEYVAQRQLDQQAGDREGRTAHGLYVANRAVMEAGAEVSNPHRFDGTILPDGTQRELSALQRYYNEVARIGPEAVATEYDNDPPAEDDDISRLVLTSHHIQHGCRTGLDRFTLPAGTVLVTRAADVQKLGLHHCTIAWNEQAVGAIVDYDFWPFVGVEGKAAADCELLILEGLWAWHASLAERELFDQAGEVHDVALTLIDMGWKDESWNSQPVQVFCAGLGYRDFLPSKGIPNYRRPHESARLVIGDQWHIAWPNGMPIVEMNSDHWKLKVHEGFLATPATPGALALFEPAEVDGRAPRNAHLSYAKHILAEVYQTRQAKGFREQRTGWWKTGKPNHWLDATYAAIVARSVRGLTTLGTSPKAKPATARSSSPQAPPVQRQPQPKPPEPTATRRRINFRRRAS